MVSGVARRAIESVVLGIGRLQSSKEAPIAGTRWRPRTVTTVGAVPELLRTIGRYNLVEFDGAFYGLPHGLSVNWESGTVAELPGVIVGSKSRTLVDQLNTLAGKSGACSRVDDDRQSSGPMGDIVHIPTEVGSSNGYRIVSYEGWVYGLPPELSDVDLIEVDVIEMPGVIRDVSRDVVEHMIAERTEVAPRRVAAGD